VGFGVKVYAVIQTYPGGSEELVAVRLTSDAARAVAKLDGGRRIDKLVATKAYCYDPETDNASSLQGGRGDKRHGHPRLTSE
jgi:hypothetical protein